MRILHMVHSATATVAGTERHILGLSRELRQLGHSVTIACASVAEPLREAARADGFEVISETAVRRHPAVDVLHAHDGRSMLGAVYASAGRRIVLVRTQHFVAPASTERAPVMRAISQLGHRALNSRLDGYVCVSREAARAAMARREVGLPVEVIAPGIQIPTDAEWQRSVTERAAAGHPVVVSAGRLDHERSFETLIHAIPEIRTRHPAAEFVIAGDGEVTAELKALAQTLGVASAIRWPGWVPDLQEVLRSAHLYVNTWPAEGFGMATAEAMAAGVPVIVTSTGAAPELVADGVGGWIVPPRDPAALAAKILEALGAPDQLVQTGAQARQRATREYSVRSCARALCDFYETLLEGASRT